MDFTKDEAKVAVITGASGALGSQLVSILKEEKYIVVACSKRTAVKDAAFSEKFDIADSEAVRRYIKEVLKRFGRIDILINNAGYAGNPKAVDKTDDENVLRMFRTNVYGPLYFMREVLPTMKRNGAGKIINIASKAGVYAVPYLSAYSASKSALIALTQGVAKELKRENVSIICVSVSPAGMNTALRAKVYGKEDARRQQDVRAVANIINNIAIGRMAVPQGANVVIKQKHPTIRVMEDG